ncbi:hypothetical protein GCM10022243_27550 [Saccharothrix violaceirubra]|uniref:Bacterial EndoU nuclease domain-containing protein n=1 Tax=Saccharothrix violaceirubra TaxID=413306 RepID=A0A7W7TA25_9PSEU|nr:EndoU domain-containing protein [Saccharothrix violaceirubra]MBB4969322.1 hypothetical protein [Saccharothrix violaceirubra]
MTSLGEVGKSLRRALDLVAQAIAHHEQAATLVDEAHALLMTTLGDARHTAFATTAKAIRATVDDLRAITALVENYLTSLGLTSTPTAWDAIQEGRTPPTFHVTEARRVHILDGDGDDENGGHAPGTGMPFKKEFPAHWSDEKIISAILDVARNPDSPPRARWNPDSWQVRGEREGVVMDVILGPDGAVWTGYPRRGRGVIHNDRYGNPTDPTR